MLLFQKVVERTWNTMPIEGINTVAFLCQKGGYEKGGDKLVSSLLW